MVKLDINSVVEVHPQLSQNRHPVDDALVDVVHSGTTRLSLRRRMWGLRVVQKYCSGVRPCSLFLKVFSLQ
jgi:hypothetical protein